MPARIEGIDEFDIDYLYNVKHLSLRRIASEYGVSYNVIYNRMEEYGIERRTNEQSTREANRKYSVNEDFFKTWSSEMAWVYGWVLGDGSYKNGHSLTFNLQPRDVDVLEKIKLVMESGHPVSPQIGATYDYVMLDISSVQIVRDLQMLSFYAVPYEFFLDFLRGFFEAEGGVTWRSFKQYSERSGVVQATISQKNPEILEYMWGTLKDLTSIQGGSLNCRNIDEIWTLSFGTYDSIELYRFMYSNCGDLFLKRKKEKFEQLIDRKGAA